MLGLGRASQYAGWWTAGTTVDITVSTSEVTIIAQSPNYSYKMDGTYDNRWNIMTDGAIDTTGVTSLTGFNNANMTVFYNVYLPWSGSLSDNSYGMPYQHVLSFDSIQYLFNSKLLVGNSGKLGIQNSWTGEFLDTLYTDDAYTNYTDRWLTVVSSQSNTSASFSGWTGGGSGTKYCRIALYDTESGALIKMADMNGFNTTIPVYANIASSLTTSSTISTDNNLYMRGQPENGESITVSGSWTSLGTMFDSESITDKTWLTTRPPQTIGNGNAWVNSQYCGITTVAADEHYLNVSGADRYTQADDYLFPYTANATVWGDTYSTTNTPRSSA